MWRDFGCGEILYEEKFLISRNLRLNMTNLHFTIKMHELRVISISKKENPGRAR